MLLRSEKFSINCTLNGTITKVNEDLDTLLTWTRKYGLKLNVEKSHTVIMGHLRLLATVDLNTIRPVSLNGVEIPYRETVKNLGIYMNKNFNWAAHVNQTCKKCCFL